GREAGGRPAGDERRGDARGRGRPRGRRVAVRPRGPLRPAREDLRRHAEVRRRRRRAPRPAHAPGRHARRGRHGALPRRAAPALEVVVRGADDAPLPSKVVSVAANRIVLEVSPAAGSALGGGSVAVKTPEGTAVAALTVDPLPPSIASASPKSFPRPGDAEITI